MYQYSDLTGWYMSYYWTSMLFWLIPLLIFYGIAIICGIWVYRDAKRRRGMPATTWLIIVLLTGIIGLIIYIVIRED